jgi:shikimate dehydrogenase
MTSVRITGATRLYAIVGDPIAQVRSPEVFTERFAAAGFDAVLVPVHVLPEQFEATISALMRLANLDGLLVTVPYKSRMVSFANTLGETARCISAVNALRREADGTWTGDMFDGVGFVRGAERKGMVLRSRRVAMFGAGGAGSAIGCELAASGVRSLSIIDPQPGRADALAKILARAFPACEIAAVQALPANVDMIVNASTVGMRSGDGLPGAIGPLAPDTLVGDVVVSEDPTPIIRHAIRYGCRYVAGRDMHSGQIEALLAFFAEPTNLPNVHHRPKPAKPVLSDNQRE